MKLKFEINNRRVLSVCRLLYRLWSNPIRSLVTIQSRVVVLLREVQIIEYIYIYIYIFFKFMEGMCALLGKLSLFHSLLLLFFLLTVHFTICSINYRASNCYHFFICFLPFKLQTITLFS